MENFLETYQSAVAALGAMGALMFIQLMIADVAGIKFKHKPGSLVESDQNNFLFRASRTLANTNESISIFILLLLFCMFSLSSPQATAYAAWGFVLSRVSFSLFYYFGIGLARSCAFAGAVASLLALLLIPIFS